MGFLGAIGSFIGGLFSSGGILSGITGVLSAVTGVMGVINAFSAPKISMPDIQIPQNLINSLNSNLAANQTLSDQAKTAAQNALQNYNSGTLSPQYQALLDNWYNQQKTNIAQQAAASGQTGSSVVQSQMAQLGQQYQAMASQYLQQQLSNSLSLANIPQTQIQDIMQGIGAINTSNYNNMATYGAATNLSNQEAANKAAALTGAANAVGNLGGSSSSTSSSNFSLPYGNLNDLNDMMSLK